MSKILPLLAGAAALASVATAQNLIAPHQFGTPPTYAFPVSYFANNNGSTTLNWRTTAARTQTLYAASVFTGQGVTGPMTITRLRYRAAQGVVNAGGSTYTGVNVRMSSSPLAPAAITTTYASNEGLDNTVVFTGNVTTTACTGTTPNDYVIDITLTTPFVYDPTTGSSLCIDFDHPAPVPTTGVPSMASAATAGYVDGASSNRAATQAAATGALSAFAPVVWIDFTGPGGVGSVSLASNQLYGEGCYLNADSFYENFPGNGTGHTFDLRGSATTVNSILLTAIGGNTNWTVTPGSNSWYTPTGSPLLTNSASPSVVMGDDSLSVPLTLPVPFTFPGGSTTVVHAAANGYLVLAPQATTVTSSDFSPSVTDLLGSTTGTHYNTPRLCPLWHDLHASRNTVGTGALTPGVYYDTDASNNAYITWVDVGEFGVGTANTSYNNFQIAILANGDVEFRYGRCDLATPTVTQNIITGFSKGRVGTVNSVDPGNRDISATMPFSTNGPDLAPLQLTVPAFTFLNESRPVVGQTVTAQVNNIPAASGFAIRLMAFAAVVPGQSLGFLGMPGCFQHIALGNQVNDLFLGTGSINMPLPIPNNPTFIGTNVFVQAATYSPGANALEFISSGGLRHRIGSH